jgi:hypothetical protein
VGSATAGAASISALPTAINGTGSNRITMLITVPAEALERLGFRWEAALN